MKGAAAQRGALTELLGRISGVAGALVLSQIIVGLTYIVAARAMTPATLGLIATCAAIGMIGATVFDAGLINLLVREVASGQLTMAHARGVVRGKRRLVVFLFVPTLAASLVIAPSMGMGAILGCLGVVVWEAQTANGLLRAQEHFSRAATGQLTGRTAGLLVVVALTLLGQPAVALPAGLVAAFAVEAIVDRVFLGSPGAPPVPPREARALYREGIGYGLASLASSAQLLDVPLVAAGGGPASAGLYAAASRLFGPLGFLGTSLGLVGTPWLARAKHDPATLRGEERRIVRLAACFCLAPLLAAAIGPTLLPALLGSEYEASGTVFAILAVGSVFSTVNQPLAVIVQNRGSQRVVAVAVGIGLGIGLAATYGLAVAGGATLAAMGFMISQLYILAHLGLAVRRLRMDRSEEGT